MIDLVVFLGCGWTMRRLAWMLRCSGCAYCFFALLWWCWLIRWFYRFFREMGNFVECMVICGVCLPICFVCEIMWTMGRDCANHRFWWMLLLWLKICCCGQSVCVVAHDTEWACAFGWLTAFLHWVVLIELPSNALTSHKFPYAECLQQLFC